MKSQTNGTSKKRVAITVDHLTRRFKQYRKQIGLSASVKAFFHREYYTITALEEISFEIDYSECVGIIGPNGAGKTTALKCLSGLLHPTSGSVSVMGYTPHERKSEFLRSISLVMGQRFQLWPDLPALESFVLSREIYAISPENYCKMFDELVSVLDLAEILEIPVRKLSLGQRMRCELAVALLHNPSILFLDEPTIGLDVTMQKRIRDFLEEHNRSQGTTILLTSHNMDDVKSLCKRLIIIDKGSVVFDGSIDRLYEKYAREKYIKIELPTEYPEETWHTYAPVVRREKGSLTLSVDRKNVSALCARILKDFEVEDISISEVDLDEIVRSIFAQKV